MQPHIKIGRLAGIDIGLHYSWLIIAVLITFSLRAHFHDINPQWSSGTLWSTALSTGLLFFASIIVHELGHALVAKARALPVQSITLFALGGVANIERDAADAKTEFWRGIAGPLISVAIGGFCTISAWLLGWSGAETPSNPPMAVLVWLGYINFMLTIFNMPGFPLDGGRVLRAALWWATGDSDWSTRTALVPVRESDFYSFSSACGSFSAAAPASGGCGWRSSAGSCSMRPGSLRQCQHRRRTARLAGSGHYDGRLRTSGWARDASGLYRRASVGHGTALLCRGGNGHAFGCEGIDRSRWPTTTVHAVMRPLDRLRTVTPDTPVVEALQPWGKKMSISYPSSRTIGSKAFCREDTSCTYCSRAPN